MKRLDPAAALYRRLLRLLPRETSEYAREMLSLTLRRRRSLRTARSATMFWLREILALAAAIGWSWIDHARISASGGLRPDRLAFELRTVLRGLVRAPVFTLAATTSLAIGVGATAGVGSVAWRTLLAPLPFHEPDGLVQIYHDADLTTGISLAEMETYRERARSISGVVGWNVREVTYAPERGPAERVVRTASSPGLFETVGRGPMLGVGFDERGPGSQVMLSEAFWRTRFEADRAVIGRSLVLDDEPHTVVGVLPADVHVPSRTVDVYVPLPDDALEVVGTNIYVDVLARARPGSDLEEVSAEIDALAREIPTAGSTSPGAGIRGGHARPLADAWRGGRASLVAATLVAAVLLLLATTANVALLVASRSGKRAADRRVRRALGASDLDIARGRVLETGAVALAATGLALALALTIERGVSQIVPSLASGWSDESIAVPLVVLSAFLAGSFVATASLVSDRGAGRRVRGGPAISAGLLVPAQIAVAMVLLTGSALLVRTVSQMLDVDLGYRVDEVTTARVSLSGATFGSPTTERAFFEDVSEQLRGALGPGGAVGVVNSLPLSGYGGSGDVYIESHDPEEPVDVIAQRLVDPGYFRAMEIPLVAGRLFTTDDREGTSRVVLVDETLAERFFGSAPAALGRRVRSFMGGDGWNEVVGVVGAVRPTGPARDISPQLYVPFAQRPTGSAHIVVAGSPPDGAPVAPLIRRIVAEVAPGVPVSDIESMSGRLDLAMADQRLATGLFGAFALVTLILTSLGSYAISALAHERREREVGIRKALGATPSTIAVLTTSVTMRALAIGLVLGVVASVAMSRGLEGLLFGVAGTDPLSFLIAAVLLSASVLCASLPAVRRGLALDTATMLRPR